jgi:hypothetical protein
MEGTILPHSLDALEIHAQHSREPRVVIDNFGDADDQVLLMVQPLEKTLNSLNEQIDSSLAGVVVWADVEHTAIVQSPHNTKGVELAWDTAEAWYRSATGGAAYAATEVLALRIGQFFPDPRNPDALSSDAFVALSDGAHEAVVRLGAVAAIPFPDSAKHVLTPMRTVRLPLDAFQAANPALDLANIQSVTIRFMARPAGHVLADDIELGA